MNVFQVMIPFKSQFFPSVLPAELSGQIRGAGCAPKAEEFPATGSRVHSTCFLSSAYDDEGFHQPPYLVSELYIYLVPTLAEFSHSPVTPFQMKK